MSKTQMSPKFRRAGMIGVGVAGAFAIAVPSIAWAVDATPDGGPVVLSETAAETVPAAEATLDCAPAMSEAELKALFADAEVLQPAPGDVPQVADRAAPALADDATLAATC